MSSRKRLYLIDGYSNIFRAFYAIRGLSSSKGQPTNAVWGFLQMLRKLLRDESPELVGVALDVSGATVRKEQYEEYKANRKPMPDDLRAQMPWVRKVIEAHRIPILELEKYEADDVLGTLSKRAAEEGYDVVLVSADKDLMQLVGPHVSVYHTGRDKLYDPKLVKEDFGVPPERVIDVLALKGDSVDNVPGVPGIGEKGAQNLIKEFGSLDELLERAGEVKRKSYREGLEEHRDKALLSKDLVTIHTDLPVEFSPEALRHDEPDSEALAEIARELEFFSLLEELGPTTSGGAVEPAVALASADEWAERAASLEEPIYLSVVGYQRVLGLAAAGAEGEVLFADFRVEGLREAVVETLEGWLADKDRSLSGHDLKEVLRLTSQGPVCAATLFDTMLASYLLRSAMRSHELAEVALDRLHYKAMTVKEAGWDKKTEPMVGHGALLGYAAEQIELPRRMAPVMRKELEAASLERLYEDLEAPLMPVLLGMEEAGILLDSDFLAGMSEEMSGQLSTLEEEIYAIADDTFNINSPRQLGEIMFERLGYPVIKKTRKTKSYSTDSETLEQLAIQGYELPAKVIDYRELSKLKSTYVDALPAMVAADDRLHTRYLQAVASTGRLSSANPNLQNIPIRTEQGQQIRRAFLAPEGKLLVVADYSQVELRVLAHIAEEEALVEAFLAGADIHRSTAATVFGVAEALVTDEQRRAAKTINFGILYGMSAFGLARNLKIERSEADRFIKTYLERFDGVRRYMDETLESAKKEGKVETLYGRIRWLPDINSRNFHLRENARRMAINARIQGTAADLQKKAMIGVDAFLRRDHPDAHLLLTVHDELVLEVPEDETDEVAARVKAEMEGVESLSVPLVVDVDSGKSWYDAKS
jgi:DNA polymerase-1